ncbi:hypothetical protein GF377_02755 [candidate division GN15 bacterium]|nr:hypothetical protein [candidate division GN15 bacterium]
MFSKLKELFMSDSLLDEAYETTVRMLEFDHTMFKDSCDSLRRSDSAELPYDFKEADRRINKFEREVRRKVLTHLTIAGNQNLVPGLTLVTIVIDVERIGDFTKNIAGLATARDQKLDAGSYEKDLQEIESLIGEQFPSVIDVLRERDSKSASSILVDEHPTAKRVETVLNGMMASEDDGMPKREAVRLALYARYLKRINAHLTNIASSVVNPFPRIGFRQKKPRS